MGSSAVVQILKKELTTLQGGQTMCTSSHGFLPETTSSE